VIRRIFKAYPALLRIGFAEAVAYRAEFVVWMLTTTMPLVMLALWSAVAESRPFGFDRTDFVAYYLGALIVRTVTSSWVVWEMNQEVRMGTFSMRLLKPIPPFAAYAAEHMAAIPLRALVALPITIVMLVTTHGARIVHSPDMLVILVLSLAGAWLVTFTLMSVMGSLSMLMERSMSLFEVYMGIFGVLSGYLVPISFLPPRIAKVAYWLPFRYMLGYPVELMIGRLSRAEALRGLGIQYGTLVVLYLILQYTWSRGVRRFEAYGA
jgi:ABC-2 type transport system permease protein